MNIGSASKPQKYLDADLSIECWGDVHKKWALQVTAPSLSFWGIMVPFYALFILVKNKEQHNTYRVKSRYGWLYEGYTKSNYFWEFVITYRKILLMFLSVFLVDLGKDIAVIL